MINDCSRGRKLQIVLELQCAFWRPVPHAATVRRLYAFPDAWFDIGFAMLKSGWTGIPLKQVSLRHEAR